MGNAPQPSPSPPSEARIQALVSLLADDAAKVREAALAAIHDARLPAARLRSMAESIDDPSARGRARALIEQVRIGELEDELRAVTRDGPDLEKGAFLLAKLEYPELDVDAYRALLDQMAGELSSEVEKATPREAARCLRRFIHDVRGFKGNTESYEDPENVFLNRVLDRKVGIPTSLAVVYLLLARRLKVPLEGVNLPLHFLIRCRDPEGETFIDAFARGRFLTRSDCRDFLREAGLEDKPEFLSPATDREVIVRLTRCLVSSYQARGASAAVERFGRCLAIVAGDAPQGR
jgi:regulator of sirC expression with transglutaminase-like and TPR domain